jgi:uncharacterized cupin superfamily protein
MSAHMMKFVAVTIALVVIAGLFAEGLAQTLPPSPVYEGDATIQAKNGVMESAHVSVKAWAVTRQEQEIPLQGFYVAHLLSGQVDATIDGQTTQHLPGDYWTVKVGAIMNARTSGDVAVLETTVVGKQ